MSKRSTETCEKCGIRASKRVVEIEVDGGEGRTVLGRRVDFSAIIGCWECPKCQNRQCVYMKLAVDPDRPVVTAYEKLFGPADGQALAALAVFNNQAIIDFGEDWVEQFGDEGVEKMLTMLIAGLRRECGDEWAISLQEAGVSFVKEGVEA